MEVASTTSSTVSRLHRRICITLASIHLFALAISTYVAANEVESILVTGWICSTTGIFAGVYGMLCRRPLLAAATFLTPIIAVTLLFLEAIFLNLGPRRAALPFCIVFIINQVIATLTILVQLNILGSAPGAQRRQITIMTMFVSMASFSLFFALAKRLLERQHDSLMAIALGLLGLTFVGLVVTMYNLYSQGDRSLVIGEETS